MQIETELQASVECLPAEVRVGKGTAVFVSGSCTHEEPVRVLRLIADGSEHSAMAHDMPSAGAFRRGDRWWAIVAFDEIEHEMHARLTVCAETASGCQRQVDLGEVRLVPGMGDACAPVEIPPAAKASLDDPLIAVCMATYNPPPDLFRVQIESIRAQTDRNWFCVISDDASEASHVAAMLDVIAGDPRFALIQQPDRLGFYGNFERVLALAPLEAELLALSDQDDRWEPTKLASLRDAMRSGAPLAYADMRIVDRNGAVLSDTFWRYRKNNSSDFGALLVGNSVTGAASMFRRSLLDHVLPFPPQAPRAFHDHWIASAAMAVGDLAYIDRPLHDYVQHEDAAIGFSASNAHRKLRPARFTDMSDRVRRTAIHSLRPEGARRYFDDYCRVALASRILEMRVGSEMSERNLREVRRLNDADSSPREVMSLLAQSLRRGLTSNLTMGVDRSIVAGLAWKHAASFRAHGFPRPNGR